MTRRTLVAWIMGGLGATVALARLWIAPSKSVAGSDPLPDGVERLELGDDEWRALLEPNAYRVLRHEDTEAPGTSPLNAEKRSGTFVCAGCFLPLFLSSKKYESGTGWPSFFDKIDGNIGTRTDYKLVLPRTEYHCVRCGGHQGHVFTDGPPPTGLRYCNNGVALRFIADGEPLPALRKAKESGASS
jgi:peptide-methionine (R)-S-oxide reductase